MNNLSRKGFFICESIEEELHMSKEEILEKLKVSIEELDPDLAETAAQEAKEEGINAIEAIN